MKKKDDRTLQIIHLPKLAEQMLDSVGSPVFVKDRRHRWIYLNDAFCEFMGRRREELLGKSDPDFFPKEQAAIFWEMDDKVFRAEAKNTNEEYFTDSAGVRHTIVTKKQAFKTEDGAEVLVGVISDITELRKANNELTVFRKLLENSNDAIFIVNPENGAFLDANETACTRLGYSKKTLLRMGVQDVQEAAAKGGWAVFSERLKDKDYLLFEGRHHRADGSSFPVEVSISRAKADGKEYLLASARDITERKKMEEAMKEVDALRGLIPICAKCKNIRDDKGFWQKVETYLEKHSQARFTHGLCRDCMRELYGKESWFKDET